MNIFNKENYDKEDTYQGMRTPNTAWWLGSPLWNEKKMLNKEH